MLPKSRRLTAREVREVLKEGRSERAGGVSARYTGSQGSKVSVVVSSKVARLAVQRNTLRRKGYRALAQLKNLPKVHMVVFILRKDFNPADITLLCSKLS